MSDFKALPLADAELIQTLMLAGMDFVSDKTTIFRDVVRVLVGRDMTEQNAIEVAKMVCYFCAYVLAERDAQAEGKTVHDRGPL